MNKFNSCSNVMLERDGNVAIITLARPDKLNALTPEMLNALKEITRRLESDDALRALVLTGEGKAFCVGADINEWSSLNALDMWRHWVRMGHDVFDGMNQLRIPVITAFNGHALGGGLELGIASDIRVADPEATFGLPEAGIATCPGWSGTQRLVDLIGVGNVKYIALTGRRLDSERARQIGLIQEVSQPGVCLDLALQIAREIASQAPISVQLTKQIINAGNGVGLPMALESMAGALSATTQDAKEGMASFQEKRPAKYNGN